LALVSEEGVGRVSPSVALVQIGTLSRDTEGDRKGLARSVTMPLLISLENVGDGFRVSIAERDNGWEYMMRSGWYSDLPSARAGEGVFGENAHCSVREIGTACKPA
jgi:hypothetical protein